jgi:hypothetical protein
MRRRLGKHHATCSVVLVLREPIVGVLADSMETFAALSIRIDMHRHAAQMRQVVKELMADFLGDRVSLGHRQLSRYADAHVGMQAMADPSCSHIGDLIDPGDVCCRMGDSVNGVRVDSVQHSEDDRPC